MKINIIKLNNIGPYKGLNIFNLDSFDNDDKNVTLIGGKNGTGKTTFLKSIKIGLFGSYSFGFKTENSTYVKEIKNLLNNQANDSDDFYIEISFSYYENFKKYIYTIKRSWIKSDDQIIEKVDVFQENNKLNDYDSLEIQNKIKSLTSPALINSFIYDGEKISSIIEQGNLELYVKELFYCIFNINIIDQLSDDLTSYMVKSYKKDNKNIEYEVSNILNKLNYVKSEIKVNEKQYDGIFKEVENLKVELFSYKKEFSTLGGLSKHELDNVIKTIGQIEKQKEENYGLIKVFLEDDFHLAIIIDGLKQVEKKAKKELPLRYAKQLEVIQNYLNIDMSIFIKELRKDVKTDIFDIDEKQLESLSNRIKAVDKDSKIIKKVMNYNSSVIDNLSEMKDSLLKNNTMDKVVAISDKIESIQNELDVKKEALLLLSTNIKELSQQRDSLLKQYDNYAEMVKKDKLSNSSYVQCINALQMCDLFKQEVVRLKMNLVAKKACEIFNKTIRKNNYIKKMHFKDDFSFLIIDGNDREISPKLLSAGEMQILVSALIWAMFKVSGRKEMFVFDTPLARLDVENRIQFIKNIVLTISDQVMILSTDSEFVGKNLKAVEKNLYNKYLLEYDDVKKTTTITNEYFGD